jgi:hypothetical protein
VDTGKKGVLAWEALWLRRAGVAAILGSLVALLGFVLLQGAIGGGANFEGLTEAHEQSSQIWLSGVATGIGYVLLALPLFVLFRAVQARSEKVRGQLVSLAIVGPLLLGVAGPLLAAGTQEAADKFLNGDAKVTLSPTEASKKCDEELKDKGAKPFAEDLGVSGAAAAKGACASKKRTESKADDAITASSLINYGRVAGFVGGLTLVVVLFYTGLWSMRTGLLTRFWGSLGMAVGFAALIGFTPLTLLWFFYLGLLLVGILPGGRPPAWAAGEAIPWPTPGEKIAADLEPEREIQEQDEEAGEPARPAAIDRPPESGSSAEPSGPRRKRKRRG